MKTGPKNQNTSWPVQLDQAPGQERDHRDDGADQPGVALGVAPGHVGVAVPVVVRRRARRGVRGSHDQPPARCVPREQRALHESRSCTPTWQDFDFVHPRVARHSRRPTSAAARRCVSGRQRASRVPSRSPARSTSAGQPLDPDARVRRHPEVGEHEPRLRPPGPPRSGVRRTSAATASCPSRATVSSPGEGGAQPLGDRGQLEGADQAQVDRARHRAGPRGGAGRWPRCPPRRARACGVRRPRHARRRGRPPRAGCAGAAGWRAR